GEPRGLSRVGSALELLPSPPPLRHRPLHASLRYLDERRIEASLLCAVRRRPRGFRPERLPRDRARAAGDGPGGAEDRADRRAEPTHHLPAAASREPPHGLGLGEDRERRAR